MNTIVERAANRGGLQSYAAVSGISNVFASSQSEQKKTCNSGKLPRRGTVRISLMGPWHWGQIGAGLLVSMADNMPHRRSGARAFVFSRRDTPRNHLHANRGSRRLRPSEIARLGNHQHPSDRGRRLLEHRQPFAADREPTGRLAAKNHVRRALGDSILTARHRRRIVSDGAGGFFPIDRRARASSRAVACGFEIKHDGLPAHDLATGSACCSRGAASTKPSTWDLDERDADA
jgi:hypothetical protein